MLRREFITLLSGVVAWPGVARAQQGGKIRRVGMLMNSNPDNPDAVSYEAAFAKGLQSLGWKEGQNLRLDLRWTAGDPNLMNNYAAELVGFAPDVLVSASTVNLAVLQRLTHTIPIVFLEVSDPVAQGFVSNLARPGGNITGFAAFEFSMGGKWLDLLKQIAPDLKQVSFIFNPETSPQSNLFQRSIEAAASSFGVEAIASPVHDDADIKAAIENAARQANGGLVFSTDSFTVARRDVIVELVARDRLPAIYAEQTFARSGGLMSYQVEFAEQFQQAASYVDRILKGAKPSDLPIQLATRFTLVINLKAARAIGVDFPMGLKLRADEVIE
jgi:putative tryptophan/tyrosine transport system substrate-binding protein